MAHGLTRCFFCNEALDGASGEAHCRKLSHLAAVHKILTSSQEFDAFVRLARPDAADDEIRICCLKALQRALMPEAMYVTGSSGKRTALRGAHDLDVVVVTREGNTLDGLDELARRLRAHGFRDVCPQRRRSKPDRRLVTATFLYYSDRLDLDIMPAHAPLDSNSWAGQQVNNLLYFKELPAWKKDMVRALKAWLRLRFDIPGLFCEIVAESLHCQPHSLQRGFLLAVTRIADSTATWRDPLDDQNDLAHDRRIKACREQLTEYCLETLAVAGSVELDLGWKCLESYPCQHDVALIFRSEFGVHRSGRTRLNAWRIMELAKQLALPLPEHFDQYAPDARDTFGDPWVVGMRRRAKTQSEAQVQWEPRVMSQAHTDMENVEPNPAGLLVFLVFIIMLCALAAGAH